MKKLLLFIYIICLNTVSVYSQESFRLDKVVLTVHDYNSKAPVFVKSFTDSTQILLSDWDFPVLPVFKSFDLLGDELGSIEFFDDANRYKLNQEDYIVKLSEKAEVVGSPEDNKIAIPWLDNFQLSAFTIKQWGAQLIITFDNIVYGSSNYPKQTLEGKCEMIYVKP